jgi:hypothetical protein
MSPEVSNEAVKEIPWLTCHRFPNVWPLDAMAVTYLNENHKYTCQVRNGKIEVQDLPQDDGQDREMNGDEGNEGNEERAEEDEPNGEQEAQEQDNERRNQVSPHLHNPG